MHAVAWHDAPATTGTTASIETFDTDTGAASPFGGDQTAVLDLEVV